MSENKNIQGLVEIISRQTHLEVEIVRAFVVLFFKEIEKTLLTSSYIKVNGLGIFRILKTSSSSKILFLGDSKGVTPEKNKQILHSENLSDKEIHTSRKDAQNKISDVILEIKEGVEPYRADLETSIANDVDKKISNTDKDLSANSILILSNPDPKGDVALEQSEEEFELISLSSLEVTTERLTPLSEKLVNTDNTVEKSSPLLDEKRSDHSLYKPKSTSDSNSLVEEVTSSSTKIEVSKLIDSQSNLLNEEKAVEKKKSTVELSPESVNSKKEESLLVNDFKSENISGRENVIKIRGINKTYNTGAPLHVLKGINIDVYRGEFISIMGSSGSGKSTLLNILGILDTYDTGEYYLDNLLVKNLSETKAAYIRNQKIGFIFQSFNLIPFKNALENVALPLYYQGVNRKKRNALALEYLDKMGLKSHALHMPNEMSGGQKQRVAIARALIAQPKIILADEPTGALDSKTSKEVMHILRDVNTREGITMLIVTHEQAVADATDRVIHIKDGVIGSIEVNNHQLLGHV